MTESRNADAQVVSKVRQEVDDLLDVGLVGLYEFVLILRGVAPNLSDRELRSYAEEVLGGLLDSGRVRLVRDEWASEEPPVEATGVVPAERDWQDPPEARYLAVERY
jgi:hypothetical protein